MHYSVHASANWLDQVISYSILKKGISKWFYRVTHMKCQENTKKIQQDTFQTKEL